MNGSIVIDREKCDGCGLCVKACHEGALSIVDGKAAVTRLDSCDGFGDCLPACPMNAISIMKKEEELRTIPSAPPCPKGVQWPIQLGLVPERSPRFKGEIVIAADCTAFVMDGFRKDILNGRPLIIACPKLKDGDRLEKLKAILSGNPIDRVVVVRMEVPCCSRLTSMVEEAAMESGNSIRIDEIVLARSGSIVRRRRTERSPSILDI